VHFTMKRILHHGYTIKATANSDGGTWRSLACISLARGPRIVELQDERRFTTEAEAEDHALRLGKHWVNNRLQRMQKCSLRENQ
jgi:hypothetical protein